MKATLGRDVESVDDELFSLADQTAQIVSQEDTPGAAIVDLLPICECLASVVPHALAVTPLVQYSFCRMVSLGPMSPQMCGREEGHAKNCSRYHIKI